MTALPNGLLTVTIPATAIPNNATYIADVLHYGHRPGVLSGTNLKGKAKKFGAYYAEARRKAAAIAQQFGVTPGYATLNRGTDTRPAPRQCLVWTKDGAPVELVLA